MNLSNCPSVKNRCFWVGGLTPLDRISNHSAVYGALICNGLLISQLNHSPGDAILLLAKTPREMDQVHQDVPPRAIESRLRDLGIILTPKAFARRIVSGSS